MEVTLDLFQQIGKLSKVKQKKALQLLGQQEWAHCAEDLIYWLDTSQHAVPYVYTLDNHPMASCNLCADSIAHPVTKLTTHLRIKHKMKDVPEIEVPTHFKEIHAVRPFTLMDYMRPIIHWWMRDPLFAIEKSRDMIATWLVVSLYTWDTIFHRGRQNIFQSADAGKTIELVKRAYFIYRNQPRWLKPYKALFGAGVSRSGVLTVSALNSEILGFPQGPDQIRQYHPSGIFMDEAAYQFQAEAAYAAVKPAIQNGGRCTLVSSANPGWFYQVCKDA